jgi:ABC-type multidrug transport system fused ATPase/permease subunit
VKGEVRIENVKFQYSSESQIVLNGINIDVKQGKTTALVGESGAGKSTLVSLIPRFYEINEGRILIDNIPISKVSQKCSRI